MIDTNLARSRTRLIHLTPFHIASDEFCLVSSARTPRLSSLNLAASKTSRGFATGLVISLLAFFSKLIFKFHPSIFD